MKTKTSNKIIKKSRSTTYPSIALNQAVSLTAKLKDNSGLGPYNRELVAKGIGHSSLSGPASSKIAAIVQFGLLSRTGNEYMQTRLADQILFPKTEKQRAIAIVEAVKKPALYSALIKKFTGQPLPKLLENTLIQDFRITPKIAGKVTKDFRSSVEFAGIFKKESTLNSSAPSQTIEDKSSTETLINGETSKTTKDYAEKNGNISINLPSGIIVSFPNKMDYSFALGEFAEEIKKLEEKGQKVLENKKKHASNDHLEKK